MKKCIPGILQEAAQTPFPPVANNLHMDADEDGDGDDGDCDGDGDDGDGDDGKCNYADDIDDNEDKKIIVIIFYLLPAALPFPP